MKKKSLNQLMRGSTKRMRFLAAAVVGCFAVVGAIFYFAVVNPLFAKASTLLGDGSSQNPYQIIDCTQLQDIGSSPSSSFILNADIDCSDTINWNNGDGFAPLTFSGKLDGRNHVITGLTIKRDSEYNAGLFDTLQTGGEVKNLTLDTEDGQEADVRISGGHAVGALAAVTESGTRITNVHSNLVVQGRMGAGDPDTLYVGGLVARSSSNIETSSSTGGVEALTVNSVAHTLIAGGLVAESNSAETGIRDSYATGNVSAHSDTPNITTICGGLIGAVHTHQAIERSYSSGSVSCAQQNSDATLAYVGGFAGKVDGNADQAEVPHFSNDFTVSHVIDPENQPNINGFFGFAQDNTIDLSLDTLDVSRSGQTTCSQLGTTDCNFANEDGQSNDYFSTSLNFPISNWDYDAVWQLGDTLPTLRVIRVTPDAPTGVEAVRAGTQFTVNWTAPATGGGRSEAISAYRVQYKEHDGTSWIDYTVNNPNTTTAAFTIDSSANTSYDFRVQAINDVGDGLLSEEATNSPVAPSVTPENLQVVNITAKSVHLQWQAVSGAESYDVQYKLATDQAWTDATAIVFDGTSTNIVQLLPHSAYNFRVAAHNQDGPGPWSAIASATTISQTSYTVSTCQQLQDVRNDVSGSYTLTNDVDCGPSISWNGGAGFIPLGSTTLPFMGSFNGNGFKINDLYIDVTQQGSVNNQITGTGLFGMAIDASIQNVALVNAVVSGHNQLSLEVDADQDGLPDSGVDLSSITDILNSDLAGGILRQSEQAAGNFPLMAVGSVVGVVSGAGTYNNLSSTNSGVVGQIAGGVIGMILPSAGYQPFEQAITSGDGTTTFSNIRSTGAVDGVVSGGLVGMAFSSLTEGHTDVPALTIKDSTSTSTVGGNVSGGLVGISLSASALIALNTDEINSDKLNAATSMRIAIQDSSASGAVSACQASSGMRFGSLGGALGAGIGTQLLSVEASGAVTTCSQTEEDLNVYGGALGGLAGTLVASRIDSSLAAGNVQALNNTSQETTNTNFFAGIAGGMTGLMVTLGDSNSQYVVNNSHASGQVELTGNVGVLSMTGGLMGAVVGSGTIKDSYATGAVTANLSDHNIAGFNFSGGLIGFGFGADVPYIMGMVLQSPVAATHGLNIDNSYASGDVKTNMHDHGMLAVISGGLTGVLIGSGNVTSSDAQGDVTNAVSENKKVNVGADSFQSLEDVFHSDDAGISISGGLSGLTLGIDSLHIGTTILHSYEDQAPITPSGNGIAFNNTYASGNVNATIAGGLFGGTEMAVKVDKSYAEGDVRGTIVGGLAGETGALTSATTMAAGFSLSPLVPPDSQIGLAILNGVSEGLGPIVYNNTYATGNVTGVPILSTLEGDISFEPLTVPVIAGGISGLYAAPGGIVQDSYASGTVTVLPRSARTLSGSTTSNIPPELPSFAGGIFGIDIAIPNPDWSAIVSGASNQDINSAFKTPAIVKNVFSASTVNLQSSTYSGGSVGVFASPINGILGDHNVDVSRLYDYQNIYFDQTKVNTAKCNGLDSPVAEASSILSTARFLDDEGNNEVPQLNDASTEIIQSIFKPTTCTSVNANNTQPNYFKTNKVNLPLNTWDFSDVWVVRKDDYPKFVAGVNTDTPSLVPDPNVPPAAISSTNTPGTIPTKSILRTQIKIIAKKLRVVSDREQVKGLKAILASVPVFAARSIPYSLVLLLLLLAAMYSWQALREYRMLSIYHRRITRIVNTKASIDNYLAITTHYLNTPVAIMGGAIELLTSLGKISPTKTSNLTVKIKHFGDAVAELLVSNQVSNALSSNDEKLINRDQPSPFKAKAVWVPASIALGLIIMANISFVYADVFNNSSYRILVEFGLYTLGVLLVGLSYRYRNSMAASKEIAKHHLAMESQLYKKRQAFIPEAIKVVTEHHENLQIASDSLKKVPQARLFFKGLDMLDGIRSGLAGVKKFASFEGDPPLFDMSTYVRKAVRDRDADANDKKITIDAKIASGMVSHIHPEEIRQLVDSLIDNAIKFSKEGGHIHVQADRRFNRFVFSVKDEGVGISEQKLPSLLKPFSRGTDSMEYNHEGLGLGLYTDKIIVERMGGNISIRSKLGEGTVTTISIPLVRGTEAELPSVLIMPESAV